MSLDRGCCVRFEFAPFHCWEVQGRTVAAATFPRLSANIFLLSDFAAAFLWGHRCCQHSLCLPVNGSRVGRPCNSSRNLV